MNFYIDTEFHEYKKKVRLFGFEIKQVDTIDLISIGIAAENGKTYYAINKEMDLKSHFENDWLCENVLKTIYTDLHNICSAKNETLASLLKGFTYQNLKLLVRFFGKSKEQIAAEICQFVYSNCGHDLELLKAHAPSAVEFYQSNGAFEQNWLKTKPTFYGYFADYDWVVFCWLFGRMIDLPQAFPMYCKDLKQMMDEKGVGSEWKQANCPQLSGEHHALNDALWNKRLHEKIQTLF